MTEKGMRILNKWYVSKHCSSDQEKLLKFEAEGQEFAKISGSQGCSTSVSDVGCWLLAHESRDLS